MGSPKEARAGAGESGSGSGDEGDAGSWRLRMDNGFRVPDRFHRQPPFYARIFGGGSHGKQRKIAKYYKKQENLLKDFSDMETMNELGGLDQNGPTEEEQRQLAKNERFAINLSNIINLILFVTKVVASVETLSMAVIASTLDSLLDLLSGFILWFTAYTMKKPNKYNYPIGKRRMQPVGIIVFASIMGTLGFQVLIESGRQLITQEHAQFQRKQEYWMVASMSSVAVVKFFLMLYCRTFKNEIVRAYAQDHFFDVITNSVGLVSALLAVRYKWWMDPVGAILIALYTITTWARTVLENVGTLIGKSAPAEYLTKLTYLIWNHHEEIQHIDTVRAYTFGTHYFVEVDIVLPGDMPLSQAHDIGESLQEKLEQLPEVERAFVHVDFEFTHRPEHKAEVITLTEKLQAKGPPASQPQEEQTVAVQGRVCALLEEDKLCSEFAAAARGGAAGPAPWTHDSPESYFAGARSPPSSPEDDCGSGASDRAFFLPGALLSTGVEQGLERAAEEDGVQVQLNNWAWLWNDEQY